MIPLSSSFKLLDALLGSKPPDPLRRLSANQHSLVDPLDTRPTPPRNAILVLSQPSPPKYDMISAGCIRAATSGPLRKLAYESLKAACGPEPRSVGNGSNPGALIF